MEMLSWWEADRSRDPRASDLIRVTRLAERVIRELDINEAPIDLELLTSYLDIAEVQQDHQMTQAGCLLRVNGRLVVRVRAQDPPVRQRFTVCHECAHTFFPGFDRSPVFRCDPGTASSLTTIVSSARPSGPALEALCDAAASALLLPASLFVPDARGLAFGVESICELAERYDASLEATARSYVSHTPGTALVILKPGLKPTQRGTSAAEQLRVSSSLANGAWRFIAKDKSAHPLGPFARALEGELVNETTHLDRNDALGQAVTVHVTARLCPLTINGLTQQRVLALLRHPAGTRA